MTRVHLTVDDAPLEAEVGTTVAVALLNAGRKRFRTSVHGEPRAPLCAMGVCHECRVTIDGVAHRRSCLVEVAEGMSVKTSGDTDAMIALGRARALEADVVVVGAGPAGIAAASTAAELGAKVIVLDENPRPSGQIWRHGAASPAQQASLGWLARLHASSANVMAQATVTFAERAANGFSILAEQAGAPVNIAARDIIIATGARERFLPFPGSTLPDVIGVGALQALIKSGYAVTGKRIVIAGTGPLLLPVAAMASAKGARVELVAEQASRASVMRFALGLWSHPSALVQAARYRASFLGTAYKLGTWVKEARGAGGVAEVDVTDGITTRTIACDVLAVAHGLIGNTELARLLGCEVNNGMVRVGSSLETTVPNVYCAGEPTGVGGVDLALVEGAVAGTKAAGGEPNARQVREVQRLRRMAARMNATFALRTELRALAVPETIVCRCEDVAMRDIRTGWTMRKTKLYTRAGMGACQGRTCGAALDYLYATGADSVRAPVQPVRLTTLAAATAADHDNGERTDG